VLTPARSRWLPAVAVFQLLLLLAVQLADGSGVHRCPEHDAGIGIGLGHRQGAGHHMHGGGDDRDPGHHGPCPCLGEGLAVSLPHSPVRALAPVPVTAVALVPLPAPRRVLLAQPAHTLPFAIGPPPTA